MPPKNKKKAAPSDAAGGDGGPPAKLNKTDSDFSAIDFGNDCKTESGDKWDFKISSWNVDGMRAWAKKGNYTQGGLKMDFGGTPESKYDFTRNASSFFYS